MDEWPAKQLPEAWQPVDVPDGEKGPLVVEALQRCVETRGARRQAAAQETLVVIRYTDRDSRVVEVDYCLSNAPTGTSFATFCRVTKAEHRIEEVLQRGKSETGMVDYEVRTRIGWQHHQTLSLIAAWYLHDRTRASQKECAALTLSQLRDIIAAAIGRRATCYSPENVQQRSQRWLRRTILARFYRYRVRRLLAPLSLERRQI